MQTYTEDDRVIVTQLPFKETVVDFWALLWDYTCTSLVLLNQIKELDQVSFACGVICGLPAPGPGSSGQGPEMLHWVLGKLLEHPRGLPGGLG